MTECRKFKVLSVPDKVQAAELINHRDKKKKEENVRNLLRKKQRAVVFSDSVNSTEKNLY